MSGLEIVTAPGEGIVVKCDRISGKLRIRLVSDGYNIMVLFALKL